MPGGDIKMMKMGSASASLSGPVDNQPVKQQSAARSNGNNDAVADHDDEADVNDDEEVLPMSPDMKRPRHSKSHSNSHSNSNSTSYSLSHHIKKHLKKHLTVPNPVAAFVTIIMSVIGIIAGFNGRSRTGKFLLALIAISALVHLVTIVIQVLQGCRSDAAANSDKVCKHTPALLAIMLVGSSMQHIVLALVTFRFVRVAILAESLGSVDCTLVGVCVAQGEEMVAFQEKTAA